MTDTKEEIVSVWTEEAFYEQQAETNSLFGVSDEVLAANLPKLIFFLTETPPLIELSDFILTYRAFMSPTQLVQAFMARYETAKENEVRIRVLELFKTWFTEFPEDFFWSVQITPEIGEICTKFFLKIEEQVLINQLKLLLEGLLAMKLRVDVPLQPTTTDRSIIMSFNYEEVARQLSLFEWTLLRRVKPWEFLNCAWMKKDKDTRAPNLTKMSRHFNYVSGLVATTIATPENIEERVKMSVRWVQVALQFYQMGNFNGVFEIVSGMTRTPVLRMKQTQKMLEETLEQQNLLDDYQDLQEFIAPTKIKKLRAIQLETAPPSVPYVAIYLTDFATIDAAYPDTVAESKLVNFSKWRGIAKKIQEIRKFQKIPYPFRTLRKVQAQLLGFKIVSEEELWDISKKVEPILEELSANSGSTITRGITSKLLKTSGEIKRRTKTAGKELNRGKPKQSQIYEDGEQSPGPKGIKTRYSIAGIQIGKVPSESAKDVFLKTEICFGENLEKAIKV